LLVLGRLVDGVTASAPPKPAKAAAPASSSALTLPRAQLL
jgi:hypothetical protein